MPELVITDSDGAQRTLALSTQRVSVGRSLENDVPFPDDLALSRRHFSLEPRERRWVIEDLGSRNGTFVNGEALVEPRILKPADRIAAGGLSLEFRDAAPALADRTVVFVPDTPLQENLMYTRLDALPQRELESAFQSSTKGGMSRVQALLEAGRALAGHTPLEEIFPLVLDLALRSVGAMRGVVLMVESGQLTPKAVRGGDFRISRTVRERVIEGRESLLVRDTRADREFNASMTMVEMSVRSFMAVPLQTEKQVLGLIYIDTPDFIRNFVSEDLTLLTVMANVAAIRVEHERLLEVEQTERLMQRELQQAADIQGKLLPAEPPKLAGYEFAGRSIPCRTVGGDYFDYIPLGGGKTGILIADVAGKGLTASLLMTGLHARMHLLAEDEIDIGRLVTRLNRSVASALPGNRFITFFLAAIEPGTGKLICANAGHNPPYIRRNDGQLEALTEGGPVLGILKSMTYTSYESQLAPGEILLLYSDGVTEALNPTGDEYGEERLEGLLKQVKPSDTAEEILQTIVRDVAVFTSYAAASDDLTLVVVRRTP